MRTCLRRFGSDRNGNFAMMTAILAIPLTLAIGTGIDIATISRSHSVLQQALDAAALGVAREGSGLSDGAALQVAEEFVHSNFAGSYSNLKVTRVGTSFRVEADATADTAFGSLLGYGQWPIRGRSTADIAYLSYEIALVLDTTGSMNDNGGGKLKAMKEAVAGLVDTMSADIADKDNLKFAMVPFSAFVNVGPGFAPAFEKDGRIRERTGAPWLDLKGSSPIAQHEMPRGVSRFEILNNLKQEWAGCVETRQPTAATPFDVTDAPPEAGKPESLFVPALSFDEPDIGFANSFIRSDVDPLDASAPTAAGRVRKYGLVEKADPLDGPPFLRAVADADFSVLQWSPVATEIEGTRGPNASCRVKPIMPLSSDYAGLKAEVQALTAGGTTNITEGVAWGWRVLSPGEPFTQGSSKVSRVRKIAIVLTDGSNVFGMRANRLGSSYSSFGYAVDERLVPMGSANETKANEAMNNKTLAACANAKADGIEIYTIRLEEPNRATGMMLKDCASDPEHFFDAPSRSQLDDVFRSIRDKIVSVRISS